MSDQHLAAIRQLLSNKQTIEVHIDGIPIQVTEPDKYEIYKIQTDKSLDDMQMGIKSVQLCLPEGLSESEVFNLMMKANYDDEQSPMRVAIDTVLGNAGMDAGDSEDADMDFTTPEPSESESATG